MSPDLVKGLIIGFIVSGVLGFFLGRIRLYWTRMKAVDRPLTVKTDKTPRQVMAESSRASCLMVLWLLLFLGAFVGGLYVLAELTL